MSAPSEWRERAACRRLTYADLFPEPVGRGRGRVDTNITRPAREACATCPVAADCLRYVLSLPVRLRVGTFAGRYWDGTTRNSRANQAALTP